MIRIENLCKHYDFGMVDALVGITMVIAKGEICSIMGPSGCGKSTLLNLLGGLDRPTSGEIFIEESPLQEMPQTRYRNLMVGFVFQQHNLIPNITLAENIRIPLLARRNLHRQQQLAIVTELLREVDLESRASFYPAQVSGGERQRAAVARALVNQPAILLADEPTGSVDSVAATIIMDMILRRCQSKTMTTLVVTHNPDIANRTERVLYMRDGRLL